MDDTLETGMQRRRQILGDDHVERAEAATTAFDADFQDFLTRFAWGEVWGRGTLDLRERHLLTLAVLSALGKERELEMHLRATANTGVSQDDVKEVLHHVAVYAGLPAANSAFGIAKRVFEGAGER